MMKIARIVVRNDGTLILGRNNGLLEPGQCYNLYESLGAIMISKVGESCINQIDTNWNQDAGVILADGNYIFTKEEFQIRQENEMVREIGIEPT